MAVKASHFHQNSQGPVGASPSTASLTEEAVFYNPPTRSTPAHRKLSEESDEGEGHHHRGRSPRKRDKVKMVGHNLHTAFRSWFKDTESDGTPALPTPLSKKYIVTDQVLGHGSFAIVKLIKERSSGEQRALKIIAKKPLKENNEKMLHEEIAILGKVEHPNIIKMWDLYETKECVFIVTDLCRGGELFDRLVEKVHYNELDARHITRQIFEGIAYLHEHDIIHRDLKPENILLRDKEDPSHVVISDFGLSKFIPDDGHLLMTACGSPQYVAPEVLLGNGYGPTVDVWSGGVIAYCLLAGYTPFYGEDQPTLFQQILSMKVEFEPEYWSDVSDTAKDFILRCLCKTRKRMTAKEALNHPYLANLPDLHPDALPEHKGKDLRKSVHRHKSAKDKLMKAVSAVEAANYLQHLHDLRTEHSEEHDIHPDRLQSLMRLSSHITSNDPDSNDTAMQGSAHTLTPNRDETPKKDDSKKDDSVRDSAMSLDLIIMMAQIPDYKGMGAGTQGVADAAMATQHGENKDGLGKDSGTSSPAQSTSGQSDVTLKPDAPHRNSNGTSRSTSKGRTPSSSKSDSKSDSSRTLDALLDQYKSSQMPSTARTNPNAEMIVPGGMSLARAWKYGHFLVNQGYSLGSAIASHAIYGPAKKSWGIEMSIFTRIMRDTAAYSELSSIAGMQQFFDLSSFLPVPKDGLITPVTYRVKKRGLKGLLKEADEAEDGTRELTGEWVVGKQTWKRLQAEWRSGKASDKERVILYIHGGAYFVMSAVTHRPITISLSKYTECRVFAVNYRLAPDCAFPGALHDCVSSWFRLVDDLGIPPQNIVIGGDSAGGGLTLALLYYLRDNKYELPCGAILFSPWVDLTISCDSWETNAPFDYLPQMKSGDHMNPVHAYLGENLEKYLTHPYASPLFGDMRGLPPLLIQAGDAEVLRDEITLLAHKASMAGVAVRHELYEDCVHVFQAFLFLDASRKALQSARHFVRTALDRRGKRKEEVKRSGRNEMDNEMRKGMANERGEEVEPTTGEKRGSGKEARKGTESDDETGEHGVPDRSDDEWDDFDTKAQKTLGKLQPAKLAGKALEADDETVTEQQNGSANNSGNQLTADMRRSKSQPYNNDSNGKKQEAATASTPVQSGGRRRQDSLPTSPLQEGSRSRRGGSAYISSASPSMMTLEQARSRAQAGLRMQESREAPQLSKFHQPQTPLQPKMRRTASHVAVTDLLKNWDSEKEKSGLNTRVFTPSEQKQ
jgi:serine/threonine protein kinase/acetyl esterase/lipase